MAKFIIAKQLAGKRIITNDGEDLGRLVDITISETSGKLESILFEPNLDNMTARKMKREGGLASIPYEAVLAASDHMIVDKKSIGY
ncbi:MAG: PRC-barrel domain-containing protein [Candidatus Anstonellales archaeon]